MSHKLLQRLKDLSNLRGLSGDEKEVSDYLIEKLSAFTTIKKDVLGNLIVNLPQKKTKPILTLDAHMDEVGFIVQGINLDGSIKVLPVGGWFTSNALSQRFWILRENGEYICGVMMAKPVHFIKKEEQNDVLTYEDIFLDIGSRSMEETLNMGIFVGSSVVPQSFFMFNNDTHMIHGKALDNRLGCAILLGLLEELKEELNEFPFHLTGLFSVQEETGAKGISTALNVLNPDMIVVLESAPADDLFTPAHLAQCALGKGPQIRKMDGGMNFPLPWFQFFKNEFEKLNIPFQVALRSSGGTNAKSTYINHSGVVSMVVSVPTRNIHTHCSIAHYPDVITTLRFIKEFLRNLKVEQGTFVFNS